MSAAAARRHRWSIATFAVFAIGMLLRGAVVIHAEDVSESSFATLQKISLNFRWAGSEIDGEAGTWTDGGFWRDRLYGLRDGRADLPALMLELEASNHPPLYYLVLHLVTAAAGGGASFAPAFALNLVFALLTMIVFHQLCIELLASRASARFGTAVFAFSLAPVFPLMLLKGYVLQVLIVLTLLLLSVRHMTLERLSWIHFANFGVICFAGFLTHYYTYVYAVILLLLLGFHYLVLRRDRRRLAGLGASFLLAVLAAVFTYPHALTDLTTDTRSLEVLEKLVDPGRIEITGGRWIDNLERIYSGPMLAFVAAVVFIAVFERSRRRQQGPFEPSAADPRGYYVIAFGTIAFIVIQTISRYTEIRYAAPAVPMLLFAIPFLFHHLLARRHALMFAFSLLLLAFSTVQIGRALAGHEPSRKVIQDWHTKNPLSAIAADEPVLILSDTLRDDVFWSALYHMRPREVAISLGALDASLLRERDDAVVLVKKSFSREPDIRRSLETAGFELAARTQRLYVFRRSVRHPSEPTKAVGTTGMDQRSASIGAK